MQKIKFIKIDKVSREYNRQEDFFPNFPEFFIFPRIAIPKISNRKN